MTSATPYTRYLTGPKANSLGFVYNAQHIVLPRLYELIDEYRAGNNPVSTPIVAAQADVVAHSMGGDIIRTLPFVNGYFAPVNFGAGLIHKLITLNTPHLGSPLATELLRTSNRCVRETFNTFGQLVLDSAVIGGASYGGGVGDLQGPGAIGGTLSPILQSLQVRPPRAPSTWGGIAVAYLGASMDASQTNGAGTGAFGEFIRTCSDPLARSLTPLGWFFLMGQSDGIVPLTSQFNNPGLTGTCPNNWPCAIHSRGTAALGFGPPAIFDVATIAVRLNELLNSPLAEFSTVP